MQCLLKKEAGQRLKAIAEPATKNPCTLLYTKTKIQDFVSGSGYC